MGYQAILFDCDGVLVDSEIVGLEDSVQYLADHGFSLGTDDLIRRFTGMRADRFAGEMRADYAQVLGRQPSDAEFETLFEGFLDIRRAKRHTLQTVPGAIAMLEALAAQPDLRLAVASSSAQPVLMSKIERFGLDRFFGGHIYSADHVAHGKPAPDIFLHAAEKLGITPNSCVVIEDSPNGVMAGVAAGAVVWGFTGGGHCLSDHPERLKRAGAVKVVHNHDELSAQLKRVGLPL